MTRQTASLQTWISRIRRGLAAAARVLRRQGVVLVAVSSTLFGQMALATHLCPPGLTMTSIAINQAAGGAGTAEASEPPGHHEDCHGVANTSNLATALCIEDCRSVSAPAPVGPEQPHDFVPAFVIPLLPVGEPAACEYSQAQEHQPPWFSSPSSPLPLRI